MNSGSNMGGNKTGKIFFNEQFDYQYENKITNFILLSAESSSSRVVFPLYKPDYPNYTFESTN
jgi:hypothetical protein